MRFSVRTAEASRGLVSCFSCVLRASVLLAVCDSASCRELETAAGLQSRCEAYRESAFQHGKVTLRIERLADDGGDLKAVSSWQLICWFDRNCLRTDMLSGTEPYKAALCGRKYIVSHNNTSPVTIGPLNDYADSAKHLGLTHPKWMGMGYNTIETMKDHQARCLLHHQGRMFEDPPALSEEVVGSVTAFRIQYRKEGVIPPEVTRAIQEEGRIEAGIASRAELREAKPVPFVFEETRWIAPSQGYALLRSHSRRLYPESQHKELVQSLETTYAFDAESGTWYPSESLFTSYLDRVLSVGTRTTAERFSLERPAPSIFELKGFGLEKGRLVSVQTGDTPGQTAYAWDGNDLVPVRRPNSLTDAGVVPTTSRSNVRYLLFVNAVILGVLGVSLLVYRRFFFKRA